MKQYSTHAAMVASVTLLASLAITATSTAKPNMVSNGVINNGTINNGTINNDHGLAYTASGKTDARTARLFKQLLKNSQHLIVETHAQPASQNQGSNYNVGVSYTVRGTTSVKTARQLIQLFRTSKHIEVTVNVNHHVASRMQARSMNQQPRQMTALPMQVVNYPAIYTQAPYQVGWYPVAVWDMPAFIPQSLPAKKSQTTEQVIEKKSNKNVLKKSLDKNVSNNISVANR